MKIILKSEAPDYTFDYPYGAAKFKTLYAYYEQDTEMEFIIEYDVTIMKIFKRNLTWRTVHE